MPASSFSHPRKVLLTDGLLRRTLAACRSLGQSQVEVTAGEMTICNRTFLSRYCRHRLIYPSPFDAPEAFIATLLTYLERQPHACLVPMEEEPLELILQHRAQFERLTRLPFPDRQTFDYCWDKQQTVDLALKVGVPVPRTVVPSGPDRLLDETRDLRFPLVIKPRRSCAARGLVYVADQSQLAALYAKIHAQYPFPLVQEEIPPGEKYDVCCLFDEASRPVATFVQREVRGYPLLNGPSSVQESVLRPDLIDLTVQMLQRIGWYGIAEAEFMIHPDDGTPVLMEINPRFWGSLQLAIACGVDFPYLLYQIGCGQKVTPVHEYRVGEFGRSLFPNDLLHLLANKQRRQMQPNFWHTRYHGDLLSWNDPLPTIGFLLSCSRYLAHKQMWRRLIHTDRTASSRQQPDQAVAGTRLEHYPEVLDMREMLLDSAAYDAIVEPSHERA